MRSSQIILLLLLFCFVNACSAPDRGTAQSSRAPGELDNLANEPGANITHEDGWAIVSRTENGDRVYWFLAPDVNNVSPAQFKKTIHVGENNVKETKIVSECDAPRQVCDDLTEAFEALSEKYQ